MSADSHTVCPKCHPDLVGWQSTKWNNGVTDHAAEELGYDRDIRENYEFYIRNGDTLVTEYDATCWTCGFHFAFVHEDQIPGLK